MATESPGVETDGLPITGPLTENLPPELQIQVFLKNSIRSFIQQFGIPGSIGFSLEGFIEHIKNTAEDIFTYTQGGNQFVELALGEIETVMELLEVYPHGNYAPDPYRLDYDLLQEYESLISIFLRFLKGFLYREELSLIKYDLLPKLASDRNLDLENWLGSVLMEEKYDEIRLESTLMSVSYYVKDKVIAGRLAYLKMLIELRKPIRSKNTQYISTS